MAILWGDTGKVVVGPLKTFSFQCATPNEVSLGTLTLPTTEPASGQVSFTVQQSDLPTVSPNPISMKYSACIIHSGKVNTAATVNYRVLKNGVSITTSNVSGTANNYLTINHWRCWDVQVGDVLEVRLWSNQTDTQLDYACLMIYPGAVVLSKAGTILKDLTYTNGVASGTSANNPTPTGAGVRSVSIPNTLGGDFTVASNAGFGSSNGVISVSVVSGTPSTIPYSISSQLGTFRLGMLDASGTGSNGYNDPNNTRAQKQGIPSTISFREMLR